MGPLDEWQQLPLKEVANLLSYLTEMIQNSSYSAVLILAYHYRSAQIYFISILLNSPFRRFLTILPKNVQIKKTFKRKGFSGIERNRTMKIEKAYEQRFCNTCLTRQRIGLPSAQCVPCGSKKHPDCLEEIFFIIRGLTISRAQAQGLQRSKHFFFTNFELDNETLKVYRRVIEARNSASNRILCHMHRKCAVVHLFK